MGIVSNIRADSNIYCTANKLEGSSLRFGLGDQPPGVSACRRRARGLCPALLPNRGRPALIPDSPSRCRCGACALRLPRGDSLFRWGRREDLGRPGYPVFSATPATVRSAREVSAGVDYS